MNVEHANFGTGKVIVVEGNGPNKKQPYISIVLAIRTFYYVLLSLRL